MALDGLVLFVVELSLYLFRFVFMLLRVLCQSPSSEPTAGEAA
jgi:hypothetical protein